MDAFVSRGVRVVFGAMAAIFLGMVLFGCGVDSPVGGGNGSSPSEIDNSLGGSGGGNLLVLPHGEAWVLTGGYDGVGFTDDGRVFDIWLSDEGVTWRSHREGAYSVVSESAIVLAYSGDDSRNGTWAIEFSNGGTTLTAHPGDDVAYVYGSLVFTRMSGINFTVPPPNPGTGGELVLPPDYAWIEEGGDWGLVFNVGGGLVMVEENSIGNWIVFGVGTYTVSGGRVVIRYVDYGLAETYTAFGDTLVMTVDGETVFFTKKSGVNFAIPTGGDLVLPSGAAWTAENEYGYFGYIFLADSQVLFVDRFRDYGIDYDWELSDVGRYETSGANITIYWRGELGDDEEYGVYSVADTLLLLSTYGEEVVLTKTPGVDVAVDLDAWYLRKAASNNRSPIHILKDLKSNGFAAHRRS